MTTNAAHHKKAKPYVFSERLPQASKLQRLRHRTSDGGIPPPRACLAFGGCAYTELWRGTQAYETPLLQPQPWTFDKSLEVRRLLICHMVSKSISRRTSFSPKFTTSPYVHHSKSSMALQLQVVALTHLRPTLSCQGLAIFKSAPERNDGSQVVVDCS